MYMCTTTLPTCLEIRKRAKLLLALATNELIPLMKRNRHTHFNLCAVPFTYNRLFCSFSLRFFLLVALRFSFLCLSTRSRSRQRKVKNSQEKGRKKQVIGEYLAAQPFNCTQDISHTIPQHGYSYTTDVDDSDR